MRKEIIKTLIWVVCHFYFLKLLQSFAQSILVAQNLFNFIGSGWISARKLYAMKDVRSQ